MVGLTGEIARVTHCSIVPSLGASKLQSKPDPRSEVRGAHVPHGGHLIGAGEEDLGPLVQLHGPLSATRAGRAAPTAAQDRF